MDKSEPFVTGNEGTIIKNVFIGIGMAILGTTFGLALYWAYNKEKTLFIVFLSVILFFYALMQMVYTLVKKDTLNDTEFRWSIGAAVFMEILSLILIILFSIVASNRLRRSDSIGTLGMQQGL